MRLQKMQGSTAHDCKRRTKEDGKGWNSRFTALMTPAMNALLGRIDRSLPGPSSLILVAHVLVASPVDFYAS